MTRLQDLEKAKALAKEGELDLSWEIVEKALTVNPDDALALLLASYIMEKANKLPIALHLARRVSELEPNRFHGWNNFGRVADQLWLVDIAERAHKRGIRAANNNADKAAAVTNLAALYINIGRFREAEALCRQGLMLKPGDHKGKANLGFCQLAQHNWAEGWDNYRYSLGTDFRKLVQYAGESEWMGEPGKCVAVYGEQGLGDEISFASMIPDALQDCSKLIIDCDKRLAGLFARSFPKAKVYGTREQKSLIWDEEDQKIDASVSMGSLGGIYRRSADKFPGTPYLVPDPDRVKMWKALFADKKRPVIGLAWTGGINRTGATYRQWTLPDLMPLFAAVDATWVSLQYKDAAADIADFKKSHPDVDIVQYPFATLTKDYDDVAALVEAMDITVCVQTAIAHLCGALGKECWVCVPKNSQWRYGESGNTIPWYKSVSVHRQTKLGEWGSVIDGLGAQLQKRFKGEATEAA